MLTFFLYTVPQDTEMIEYETKSFLAKVWELNKVMWRVNAGLSASHKFASRPKVTSKSVLSKKGH